MSKKLILLIFLTIVLILLSIYLIRTSLLASFTRSLNFGVANREFDWQIPDLPPGYEWKEMSPSQEQIERYSVYYDDRYLNPTDSPDTAVPDSKINKSRMKISGKIYKTEISDSDKKYLDSGSNLFQSYLSPFLLSKGWFIGRKYDNYFIAGASKDPNDSDNTNNYHGFIKTNGYIVRSYVYYYKISSLGSAFGTNYCPCSVSMEIFISDPVDIRTFIPAIE